MSIFISLFVSLFHSLTINSLALSLMFWIDILSPLSFVITQGIYILKNTLTWKVTSHLISGVKVQALKVFFQRTALTYCLHIFM